MYNVRRACLILVLADSFVFLCFFARLVQHSEVQSFFVYQLQIRLNLNPFFLLQLQKLEWLQSYLHLLIAKSKCTAQCYRFRLGTFPKTLSHAGNIPCRDALCQHASLVAARSICVV